MSDNRKRTILVVEDDEQLREAFIDTLELNDYLCLQAADGQQALQVLQNQQADMIVSDVNMPNMDGLQLLKQARQLYPHIPVLLVTAFASISRSVDAMRYGAADYIVKPFEPEVLLTLLRTHLGERSQNDDAPIAEDAASKRVLQLAARVAQTEATVLISGESGTGKEVLARYIHSQSARSEEAFVAINCAAIPENMLEAILFGYEKGAFTGAHQSSAGKFEQANGGTLLLDEISEMDISLQAKLLRVLQEQEVERLGGKKTIALNVRVLATSNRDMAAAVQAGEFREDLYYRLNVFPLRWQPLRDRPGDILPLAQHLLAHHAGKMARSAVRLGAGAAQKLLQHNWPGNIRELDNVMQRALILQPHSEIQTEDICIADEATTVLQAVQQEPPATDPGVASQPPPAIAGFDSLQAAANDLDASLQDHEFELIAQCLARNNYNRQQSASELGVSERTLRYRLAKMRERGFVVDRKSPA